MNEPSSTTTGQPSSTLLEVPVVPEVPAIPSVPGLWVISSDGLLTIRTGYEHHKNEVHLDYEQAVMVHQAMGEAIKNRLMLPPPKGEEPGYWESRPGYERGADAFRILRAQLNK